MAPIAAAAATGTHYRAQQHRMAADHQLASMLPLQEAAATGDEAGVLQLRAGADVNKRSATGRTALHVAAGF